MITGSPKVECHSPLLAAVTHIETISTLTDTCTLTSSSVTHSTDTFYGILCSGLTHKTKLSFTSSNSSFIECVRNYNAFILPSLHNAQSLCNSGTSLQAMHTCSVSQRELTGTHTFQYVYFKQCVSPSNGGAIHSTTSSTVLNIENCEFTDCSSGDELGGAIYSNGIKRISVISTDFHACSGFTGGAVCLLSISEHFTIKQCIFSSCRASSMAGCLRTLFCTSDTPYFTHTCSFINANKISDADNLSGGGISCYISTADQKTIFYNTLFAHNSPFRGGGFTLQLNLGDIPTVQFCFFSGNYASGRNGDDIYIIQVDNMFVLYSFTTNERSHSIFAESHTDQTPNWLPQGRLSPLVDDCTTIRRYIFALTSSSVTHSTDTFYGIICSGLTDKTRLSFTSSNSSFSECVRQHPSYVFSSSSSGNSCTSSSYDGCAFNSPTRPSLSTITTFTSCNFTGFTYSNHGGAISCTGSSTKLYINQCSFKSCVSSAGHGGAIYADRMLSFSVEWTLFFSCNSSTKQGGGIYFISSYCFPLVSDTTFISCYAQNSPNSDNFDDGGGLVITCSLPSSQLHYIIQSSRFLSCGCNDFGGGGYIVLNSSRTGCQNCLFSGCKCSTAEGIRFSLGTADANVLLLFCFFSCSTSSNPPTDVAINYYDATFTTLIFHSFSTKSASRSVGTWMKWTNYQCRN